MLANSVSDVKKYFVYCELTFITLLRCHYTQYCPTVSCCGEVQGCILIPLLIFCAEIKKLEEQYHAIEIPNEESVATYFKIRQQLAKLGKEIQEFIHKPKYCLPFLQPGRLVKVGLHTLTPWWWDHFLLIAYFYTIFCREPIGEKWRGWLWLGSCCELLQEVKCEGEFSWCEVFVKP